MQIPESSPFPIRFSALPKENISVVELCMCMHQSDFVRTVTSTVVDGFQNKLPQLFSIICRCAI